MMLNPETPEPAKAAYRMKKDIESAVAGAIERFQKETGLTPSDITIHLVDKSTYHDSPLHMFMVGSVEVKITV